MRGFGKAPRILIAFMVLVVPSPPRLRKHRQCWNRFYDPCGPGMVTPGQNGLLISQHYSKESLPGFHGDIGGTYCAVRQHGLSNVFPRRRAEVILELKLVMPSWDGIPLQRQASASEVCDTE